MSNGKLVLQKKLNDEQDSEDAMVQDANVGDYKGVFYNDNTEQKYYEHGAHFQFKDLCRRLEALLRQLSPTRRGNPNESHSSNVNGGDNGREKLQSRNQAKNGNLIAGSNTLNLQQSISKSKVTNGNGKSSLLVNTHLYTSNKTKNGAEFKSIEYYTDKNLLSSVNVKPAANFEMTRTINKDKDDILMSKNYPENFKSKVNSFNYNNKIAKGFKENKESKNIYVGKKEISLHNKANSMLSNHDLSTINKSINSGLGQLKFPNHNSNTIKSDMLNKGSKLVELKNLEKLHHSKNAELYRFMTSSIERTKDISKQKSIKISNPNEKKTLSFAEIDLSRNKGQSFDINKNGGLTEIMLNQNKSRNNQSAFGKNNNIFSSDKTPTYNSLNINFKNDHLTMINKGIKSKSNLDINIAKQVKSGSRNTMFSGKNLDSKLTRTLNPAINNFLKNDYKKKENIYSTINKNIYSKIDLGKNEPSVYKEIKSKGVSIEKGDFLAKNSIGKSKFVLEKGRKHSYDKH